MKKNSIWLDGIKKQKYPKLDNDIFVDVLIIGGGITGISAAYHLRNSNLNVCLVDRNRIGEGISSKTTGKLTYLQDLIYTKLKNRYSFDIAYKYYKSQKEAIKIVEKIIKDNNIDCNFTRQKSYLFASNKEDIENVKKEKELLNYMRAKVVEEPLPIDLSNYYAISASDTAYFHPVKYLDALAKICFPKIKIFENTRVVKMKKEKDSYICYTETIKIKAKKVVLACHYPFFLFPFFFPLKGHLERSYISASFVKNNLNASGINTDKSAKSFRFHTNLNKNYFIYLSGSHSLDLKYNVKENFEKLKKELKELRLKPTNIWSNIDIITNDHLPYIGYIDDNLLIATGYNAWGMTNGSIAGKLLGDIILNKENSYYELFNPSRSASDFLSITKDIFCSAKPFVENKIIKNKNFYTQNVSFEKINSDNVGIYTDENNIKHIVYNRCPHLKCSLIFNEVEKTWDCPCHASRFDIDGKVIEGPSCYNITYNKNNGV